MIRSYFRIAFRNISKNSGLFYINVTGLALGIATSVIILLYVLDELSYDRYNEKADRIIRVVLEGRLNGEIIKEAVTPAPVAATLVREFPEVLDGTRIKQGGSPTIRYKNTTFRDSRLAFVDPNFWNVFTLDFLQGDPATALQEPRTIVITKDEAKRYFGEEDPIDKLLEFQGQNEFYRVTGVIENVPANSHFHFGLFASMEGVADAKVENWLASSYYNYIVVAEGTNVRELEGKLPAIIEKYMGPQVNQIGMTLAQFRANGNEIGLFFQPLTDIHLYSDFASPTEMEPGGNVRTVYIFSAVAIFMLVVASINFMNLSTAGATRRNREIAVKKVLGSLRGQLVRQFMLESFIATASAMLAALLIVMLSLPTFNRLSGKSLDMSFLMEPKLIVILVLLLIIVTLLAGSYPAFYLSSISPISALRNKASSGKGKGVRSVLVAFQFMVSAGLVLAIIVVSQQMSYIQNKEIGYEREGLIVLRESHLLGNNENAFLNKLLGDTRVENVTMSAFVPAGPTDINMIGVYPRGNDEALARAILYQIDHRYIPTLGMTLLKGRNFSDTGRDSLLHSVIINETAVRALGLGDDPLGQILTARPDGGTLDLTVIGVVKDFHYRSLHEAIAPLIMVYNPYGSLIVRAKIKEIPALIADMEAAWKGFQVEEPFSYGLLDELYNKTYLPEQKMDTILKIFGMLTILVACLGLIGLVTFAAEQRVKEIGIRKVLGAEVTEIVSLLSKDLLVLVIISFAVAFPLGYYLMDKWLQDFVYRVELQWWTFGLAGVITLLIAFFTMGYKTISYARANPVKSLRSE